jgi:3-methyladenine DNA glycosylase/8-oxoguanine DNA glycosylase
MLAIDGPANPSGDWAWSTDTLGIDIVAPTFTDDALRDLLARHAGLRPFAHGSLWEGLAGSIVGQGVSVAGGATLLSRIAALVHPGVRLAGRTLWPMPTPVEIAALGGERLREVGLTRQRAAALADAAGAIRDGVLTISDPLRFREEALAIRGIGPWTVASALLWGVGDADIHPAGDVALLRAARRFLDDPTLSMRELDALSERWRPYRSWAARLLWLELLGPAE